MEVKMRNLKYFCISVTIVWVQTCSYAVSFRGLGDLPGGSYESNPWGLTPDGRIVVGDSQTSQGTKAFIWEAGVMTQLVDPPDSVGLLTTATSVSADGSYIAGTVGITSSTAQAAAVGGKIVRWHYKVPELLGISPNAAFLKALDSSADGTIIVGHGRDSGNYHLGFRWEEGIWTEITSDTHQDCVLYSCSDNGSILAGFLDNGSDAAEVVFRYEGGVLTELGGFPEGNFLGCAFNISGDGSMILGTAINYSGQTACRWVNGVPEALLYLEGLGAVHSILRRIIGLLLDSASSRPDQIKLSSGIPTTGCVGCRMF
jgi:uncharacterized membrane protein